MYSEAVKLKYDEAELEEAIIKFFSDQGYESLHGDEIHRKLDSILLEDDLKLFLSARYSDLKTAEIEKIISRLQNIPAMPLYAGNKETFMLINEGFDLQREETEKNAEHINYIDFDTPENNIFKVVNQYSIQGEHLRRPDLLLFINGIPIAIFEFKTAIDENKSTYDAWKQIHVRYARDIPKLMKYCFLSVISDGANTKMASIFSPYKYYYSWSKANEEEKTSNGISALFTMIKGVFSKDRVIAILRDFVYYPDDSKDDEAIVAHYPQFFAANKMLESIKTNMKPKGSGKCGIYFGATGCGKTYAMLFLSRLLMLREREIFNNPTIIIIVDREDLDSQASGKFVRAKKYLRDNNVRSIESRKDLMNELSNKTSGGVYITTIQKFCEYTGLLSDRNNIICISDEAHRTQSGIEAKLKKTNEGVSFTYGFAKYLRDSFPNASYCGFTATPTEEAISIFSDNGKVVDSYTMKEAVDDGITTRMAYEPRLARVFLSDELAREVQKCYDEFENEGSNSEQIEQSKRAMSQMRRILGLPERLKRLAEDITEHYEKLCAEKPKIVQKAMIVCADRMLAYKLLKEIKSIHPDWNEKIKLVATRDADDEKELYELCGTREYRQNLDKEFKNNDSNFKIAIVVDMWITGFDVPSLAVMYIDKPLQKHALIQTISRVNRIFEGKNRGLIVDYFGIKRNMLEAFKKYGSPQENPIDEKEISFSIFRNNLALLDELFHYFNAEKFYKGIPYERLVCLNLAAEYIQINKEAENKFMDYSRKMKAAYEICYPSGDLSEEEVIKAGFYLAIRSIIYKQTKGDTPDAEIMNQIIEEMIHKAITCTGVENIVNADNLDDIFGEKIKIEIDGAKLPFSKFNALLKLLRRTLSEYGKINKVKAIEFAERLKATVDKYNNRDALVFTSEVVADFVNGLSDELIKIFSDLHDDKNSFEALGITFEEKAFYDILIKVRNEHSFQYADDKCIMLAKKIKELVDDKIKYVDWDTKNNIKNQLNQDLTILLYNNGYPPTWNDEVFEKVMEQARNFKKWAG